MQKAIENYIEVNRKGMSLFEIEDEIDKVKRAAIEKARKKQLREWRKLNK